MKNWRWFALCFSLSLSVLVLAYEIGENVGVMRMVAPRSITPRSILERMNPRVYAQSFGPSSYYPTFPIDIDRVTVPNSSTCPQTTTFYYSEIVITNNTAGAVTITIKDRQGTPHFLFNAVSVPANGVIQDTCLDGCKMTSGFCWQAGAATSLDGYVKGWNQ